MIDIIVNPVSGKGVGLTALEKVKKYLDENSISYNVHVLEKHGDGVNVTQDVCRSGATVIAAIGGDGTFHEILNGMDFSNTRLGLIPAGRGNDYAVGAGLSFDAVTAMKSIVHGRFQDRDYIQVGSRRCLNVCGTGLDVEVLRLTEKYKTFLSYNASLAKCLLKYEPYIVRVELNGEQKEYKCVMAAFCNGTQFGGGIKLCPDAKIADGKMNLLIVKEPNCPTIFVMPNFVAGHHIGKYYVEHVVCEKAKIICCSSNYIELDGEIYEDNELDAHIVQGGFKTFMP